LCGHVIVVGLANLLHNGLRQGDLVLACALGKHTGSQGNEVRNLDISRFACKLRLVGVSLDQAQQPVDGGLQEARSPETISTCSR
jgi:hypothetical protein